MPTAEERELSQYVPGFRANLNLSPQQATSKLLGCVDSETNAAAPGLGEMFNMDDVDETDPEDVNTRVADTPDKFIGVSRRVAFWREFHDSAWFDNVDKVREITDPTSTKMQAIMAGLGRKRDSYIQAGMLGVTYEKTDNTDASIVPVAFPATQQVAADQQVFLHKDEIVPGAGTPYGMSLGKLIAANFLLDEAELEGERYLLASSQQKGDLLGSIPATSRYYQEAVALAEGKINRIMGFTVVTMSRRRMLKTGANRRCIAWLKPAFQYKGAMITNARIAVRNDKSDTPQAFYKASHAGGRRYDAGIVEVLCKE